MTAYASGHSHVCSNGKLKPVPNADCSAGCGRRPRLSVREAAMLLDARILGWAAARAAVLEALVDAEEARKDVEALGVPESWGRLYETEGGEITG